MYIKQDEVSLVAFARINRSRRIVRNIVIRTNNPFPYLSPVLLFPFSLSSTARYNRASRLDRFPKHVASRRRMCVPCSRLIREWERRFPCARVLLRRELGDFRFRFVLVVWRRFGLVVKVHETRQHRNHRRDLLLRVELDVLRHIRLILDGDAPIHEGHQAE